MMDPADSMVQSIIDRNRKAAKRAEEKATAIGAGVALCAFEIVTAVGVVHLPLLGGINLYEPVGFALCGALGAAIGKWMGRPKVRR
jgi:hypothetical protein